MKKRPIADRLIVVLIGLLLVALLGTLLFSPTNPAPTGRTFSLADGGTVELLTVVYTNNFQYQHQSSPKFIRVLAPLIPDTIEKRFSNSGSMGIGGVGTNLMVVTMRTGGSQGAGGSRLLRMRLTDDQGNVFDGGQMSGTLGFGSDTINFWRVRAFNRRSGNIALDWVVREADGSTSIVGPVTLENPVAVPDDFAQWKPLGLPQGKTNAGLAVKLERFRSLAAADGPAFGAAALATSGVTELDFTFTEAGQLMDHFRIQTLRLSDITGNQLSPYLNHQRPRGVDRVTGGAVVLSGALWPGEDAWRIEADVLRTGDLPPNVIWQVPALPLDAGQRYLPLTNIFTAAEAVQVQLANLVPPGLVASNQWQWIVRHWGNEANVFTIGVEFPSPMPDVRLLVLEARDESGNDVPLLEHRSENESLQALFFQPKTAATQLHLKLAFPELKKFEFLARPEFVGETAEVGETVAEQ